MRRILVPLDGSRLATKILPDAERLAETGGTIILMHDVRHPLHDAVMTEVDTDPATGNPRDYLDIVAEGLRAHGTEVEIRTTLLNDVSYSIDEAARLFKADMIACATHGRGPFGRFVRGGVAWRTLAHSTVPVMLRHFDPETPRPSFTDITQRRILVPLDRSSLAESAIPVAAQLAREWNASLVPMYVVPRVQTAGSAYGYRYVDLTHYEVERVEGQQYLDAIDWQGVKNVASRAVIGGVMESLVDAVADERITDVVMTSHGRTGLGRVIVGSVADALVHRLTCPIIIIPALAAKHLAAAPSPKANDVLVAPAT